MIKQTKETIWRLFKQIDAKLKFPNLNQNEIGIQVGFDMSSSITSDLFSMYSKVNPNGKVIGIEPDARNISLAQEIIDKENANIELVQKAVFSEQGEVEIAFGEQASWNQLTNIPIDSTVSFNGLKTTVPMDTLDNIIKDCNIEISQIGHINLTINGSEYYAILGMKNILTKSKNIALTIVAGRHDESGDINGTPDHEMIFKELDKYDFNYRFKRIHQLFWWSFIVKLLLNRKWIFGQDNYGVIMASKGNKKTKWYQSYS